MKYEETPVKTSKNLGKELAIKNAKSLSTGRLLAILIARHKLALVAAWAIIMTINWALPELPSIIMSLWS